MRPIGLWRTRLWPTLLGATVALGLGCGGRPGVLNPSGDDGSSRDASGGDARLDALAADAHSDSSFPPGVPISDIRFQDLHRVDGNPRKINPNTIDATEPDNLVRLFVEPMVASPPPLSYSWSVDLGVLVTESGAEVEFRSSEEGAAHVACTVRNTLTGETLLRQATVTVARAVQSAPILRGDWAAWSLDGSTVQAVYLPTREPRTLGPGQLDSFDGRLAAAKPEVFGDKRILLYDATSGEASSVAPASIQSSWDFNYLHVTGDRLYWSTDNTTYQQSSLYTMALAEGAERYVYGSDVRSTVVASSQRIVYVVPDPPGPGFHNYLYDPATSSTVPLLALDAWGLVVSWHDPWAVLQGYDEHRVVNVETGQVIVVQTSFDSIVAAEVSEGYYGGQGREAFGDESELFLVALDGSYDHRIHFDHNDFMNLTVDGGRIAWVQDGDIYLFEAER